MSFISDLAKYVVNTALKGESVSATSVAQFTVNQVLNNINRSSDTGTNSTTGASTNVPSLSIEKNVNAKSGTRIQMDPDLNTHIPVYYGQYVTTGIITDAALSQDNLTMTYCFVISEKTGQSDFLENRLINRGSTYFKSIFVNGEELIFYQDGVTVRGSLVPVGDGADDLFDVQSTEFSNAFDQKIQVYLYDGDSRVPAVPTAFEDHATVSNGLPFAYDVMPGWNALYMMRDLVFAIVRVKYSPEARLTTVPKIEFECINPLTLPGEVIYDYMTNERYGCGIPESEIFKGV